MDFFGASLKVNNLGGYCNDADLNNNCTAIVDGHDTSQPILLYENVGMLRKAAYPGYEPVEGAPLTRVHLKVEVAPGSKYKANAPRNNGFGRQPMFGEINLGGRLRFNEEDGVDMTHREGVAVGDNDPATFFADCANDGVTCTNEATFIFTLLDGGDEGTGDGATMEPIKGLLFFAFSYFDFDKANAQRDDGIECLTLHTGADKYDTAFVGDRIAQSTTSDNAPKYCATIYGNRFDNPADPGDVGEVESVDANGVMSFKRGTGKEDVRDTAVLFGFRNTPMMEVTYSVQCCIGDGRNFLFAGAASPLTPCESPPSPPPSPPRAVLQPRQCVATADGVSRCIQITEGLSLDDGRVQAMIERHFADPSP